MKNPIIALLCLCSSVFVTAQKVTISGTIEDGQTGEQLVSANIYEGNTLAGTTSNFYGFYSLNLPTGKIKLVYSYMGYVNQEFDLNLSKDTTINIGLMPDLMIEEVTITDKGPTATVRSSQMSMVEIPIVQAKQLPVLLGEVDIIKTIQLMPGVQGGTEGLSGMYVRGGGPSENLILLDGVPVYNLSHLFGFFSIFNADAIHSFNMYKGGFPARYGGRLSSVLDIKMKEGNMKEFKGSGSIGLISSKLMLEGPIVKDKASFMISGRRSYIDVLTWPIQKIYSAKSKDEDMLFGYYLYDLNAKINYKISDKSRMYFSMYSGKDKAYDYYKYKGEYSYSYTDDNGTTHTDRYINDDEWDMEFWWGNITSALRWNYIFSPNLFGNISATYSRYRMQISDEGKYNSINYYDGVKSEYGSEYFFAYYSGIEDIALKADFDYIPSNNHYIRFGYNNTFHRFSPGVTIDRNDYNDSEYSSDIDTTYGAEDILANEMAVYVEDEIKLGDQLKVNLGLRSAMFNVQKRNYYSIEPRISTRFLVNDKLSFKASYAYMQQYIHLLTNSSMSLPLDLWMPVTDSIKPAKSWQVAAGMAMNLGKGFELTLEAYYKELSGVIEYKEGSTYYDFDGGWEGNIESGKGTNYGFEILLQRQEGKTRGWVGYTLSWADRLFPEISHGEPFPFKYDRRHDLSIVLTHSFNERIDLGTSWVYGTGYPFTMGQQLYPSLLGLGLTGKGEAGGYRHNNQGFIERIEHRNNTKLPNYHRLDIGLTFHKKKPWGMRDFSFGAYNAYSRLNAFLVYADYKYDEYSHITNSPKKEFKQITFFPLIPYVRWNFNF